MENVMNDLPSRGIGRRRVKEIIPRGCSVSGAKRGGSEGNHIRAGAGCDEAIYDVLSGRLA